MRILYLNHNVVRQSGTYFRAYQAARHLVQRGHSVTQMSISPQRRWGFEREVSEGVEIVHTPDWLWGRGRTGWDPWDTLNRIVRLHGHAWDIIHAWDCRPAVILPALYARAESRSRAGRLLTDWGDWWGRGGTQAERVDGLPKGLIGPVETYFEEAFRTRADGCTVVSRALYERARGLGVPPGRLWLVPQGCEIDRPELMERAMARQQLGLPLAQPMLVSVGALTRSDAELLFATLRRLFRLRPDVRFFMIGWPGVPLPPDLKLAPQLILTGYVAEAALRAYMAACDGLLVTLADTLASRARWPSKVNPFLAAGRATVVTAVGDLAELLAREQAALVTGCDPEDIVHSLQRLFDELGLRECIERQALHVARDILAWPKLAAQLEEIYQILRQV